MGVSDVGVTIPPNKKNQNRQRRSTAPSKQPLFRPRKATQTFWGGDGTVVCPDSVRMTLPYEETLLPTTASAGLYLYQYRGNSVFDPNYTGTGGQPAGFDVWAQFYNEYVVLSSRMEVEVIGATSGTVEYVTYPSYNTSAPSNSEDASARPYAERHIVAAVGNAVKSTLASSMSTAQLLGVREEAVIDDDAYGATTGTSPGANEVWYWNIVAQNINNSNTLADVVRVRILYDVMFHDRVQLNLSSTPRGSHQPSSTTGALAAQPSQSSEVLSFAEAVRELMLASSGKSNLPKQ
jgi:hypothetical protein